MLFSLMLTFASLAPSLQDQVRTHVTSSTVKMVECLGPCPSSPKDRMQEQLERTKAMSKSLEAANRKLEAQLLESQKFLQQGKTKKAH